MEYWIDGYNLIHRMDWLRTCTLARARERLEAALVPLQTPMRVYFDARSGGDGPVGQPGSRSSKIALVFTAGESADDRILSDLQNAKPGTVTVVTDDRELRGRAKQQRANTLGVDKFVERMEKAARPPVKPPEGRAKAASRNRDGRPASALSRSEVDEWMRIFGFEGKDPSP